MSCIALSIPQAIMLRRVLKLPLLALFFGAVTFGIVVIGFLFNLLPLRTRLPIDHRRSIVMIIKILGPGCANCASLDKNTRAALVALSMTADVERSPTTRRYWSTGS